MKTITANFAKKASEYNYYTLENIPVNVLADEWFAKSYDFKKELFAKNSIPEGLESIPDIEVYAFAKVNEQFKNNFKDEAKEHELYYIDHFYTLIYSEKLNLLCQLMNRNGKYYLFPLYDVVNKLHHKTSYEQRKPFLSQIKEPNMIGVFTAKKINDWLNYCIDYVAKCEECLNSVTNKSSENQKIIDETIKSLGGCNVHKYNNSTEIQTPLFRITFELLDNGAYLRKKIEYTGTIGDIIKIINLD